MKPFYVLNWNFNSRKLVKYDIMPYLIDRYKNKKQSDRPETKEEIKQFILDSSKYQWWARCEYEIIISDWPNQQTHKKIDIYYQVEMNIDVILDMFIENIK